MGLAPRMARTIQGAVCAFAIAGPAVAGLGFAGCDVTTAEVPRGGTCDPFEIVDLSPAPGEVGVLPDVAPSVAFNDFPDPDSINVGSMTLLTGLFYHTGRYWIDLIERRAFFQSTGELTLGQGYTLEVQPGIRSLRGCQLQPPEPTADGLHPAAYFAMFQVIDPGVARPPEPVAPVVTTAQTIPIFAGHCAGAACHLASDIPATDDAACLAEPAGALSLCGRDAFGALVAVPSIQVDLLVRVAPRDSSRSYLLRKLLGAPPLTGHVGSPTVPLSRTELVTIEQWIDTGAAN